MITSNATMGIRQWAMSARKPSKATAFDVVMVFVVLAMIAAMVAAELMRGVRTSAN